MVTKMSAFKVYGIVLPRWFAAPACIFAVILGSVLAGGVNLLTSIAVIASLAVMVGGHTYNSFGDWLYGLDRGPVRSVSKWYTAGSQAIVLGWTTPAKALAMAMLSYAISAALIGYIAYEVGTWWPFFGWGIGVAAGILYAPGFMKGYKCIGFPELCGFSFGVGGAAVGYASVSGAMDLPLVILCGLGVALPWALMWPIDQAVDYDSDKVKGVRNLGTIFMETGAKLSTWIALTFIVSLIGLLFLIQIGYFSPWAMLAALSYPFWGLSYAWVDRDITKGVQHGLLAIFSYEFMVVIGQWISRF